ncbi:MAG: hypothetical protein LLG97_19625 [Deltaproteobacteria bacterium]|nr:hypothetical protein [Deltaproteobacteria bacterium]
MKKVRFSLAWILTVVALTLVMTTQSIAAYSVKQTWLRFSATAGETLATGNVVCLKDADGYAYKADANDAALRPAVGIIGKGGASGAKVEIIAVGILSGWTALTEGAPGYLSETAAAVTQSAPAYSQQVGYAITSTDYLFSFQNYFDSSSLTVLGTLSGASPLVLEGATADEFETTIAPTDPTADRTITLPDASGTTMLSTLATNAPDAANSVTGASNGLVFEGATADAFETTITPTDPTADRTVTLADASGTVMLSSLATNAPDAANSVTGASNGLVFEGATADAFETTVTPTDPTADRTITLPNKSGTVQLASAASVLTPGAAVALTVGLSNVYTLAINDNEDTTITFSGAGTAGDEITIIFATGAGAAGDEIVTFHATLVSSVGTLTLANTASRFYTVRFISDGSHWYEVSRTAIQT